MSFTEKQLAELVSERHADYVNEAKIEAVATADAHLTNAGLPSYTALLALLDYAENSASYLGKRSEIWDALRANRLRAYD